MEKEKTLAIRISAKDLAEIDKFSKEIDRTRSEVVRRMMKLIHLPEARRILGYPSWRQDETNS